MRGKAVDRQAVIVRERDHPRLCGEKSKITRSGGSTSGSPPPMRGKADLGVSATATGGITPAYAGKRLANLFGVTTD